MALIQIQNIGKFYKNKMVLDDVSFDINEKDIIGIVGINGVGKSTLLKILATLLKPSKGEIFYKGKSITKHPSAIRGDIGYVPQDIALYQELSGMDNLIYMARAYHILKDTRKEAINYVKDIIGLDDNTLKRKVSTYSGGMKRRLNIGVALLHNPEVIIMDEPTVGIDILSKQEIIRVINELNKKGKTILYTTHNFEEIEQICNKLCIIDKGKVVEFNDIESIVGEERTRTSKLTDYYVHKLQGECV